ncbi:MAG: DUF4491 family protein [Fretibacterium sp.]|nr:DUF4491 family protein [Fretibacterium sp.]
MNWSGIIIGVMTFLIIGVFHPIVIKCEYYFTDRVWPVFLVLGLACGGASLLAAHHLVSSLLGVLSCVLLWCVRELKEQRQRVEKGWFPRNPKRAHQPNGRPEPREDSF